MTAPALQHLKDPTWHLEHDQHSLNTSSLFQLTKGQSTGRSNRETNTDCAINLHRCMSAAHDSSPVDLLPINRRLTQGGRAALGCGKTACLLLRPSAGRPGHNRGPRMFAARCPDHLKSSYAGLFPGGPGVKTPPCNAGDTGSIPGLGRAPACRGATEPVCHNYCAHGRKSLCSPELEKAQAEQ